MHDVEELKTYRFPEPEKKENSSGINALTGKLKRLIKPTLGFKSMKTAYATIKGFSTMSKYQLHEK